jgi:CheY-like chemotaxis protein
MRITVRDTGIGIAPQHMHSLFQSFQQVPGVVTRHGGTGLGLSICKQLAHEMGARIWCESTLGVGTMFVVDHIPVVPPSVAHQSQSSMRLPSSPPISPASATPSEASPSSRSSAVAAAFVALETVRDCMTHDLRPNLLQNARVLILSPRVGSCSMWRCAMEAIGCTVAISGTLDEAMSMLEARRLEPFDVLMMDGYDSLIESQTPRRRRAVRRAVEGDISPSMNAGDRPDPDDDPDDQEDDDTVESSGVRMIHSVLERRIAAICSLVLVFVSESSRHRGRRGDSDINSTLVKLARLSPDDLSVTTPPMLLSANDPVEVTFTAAAPHPLLAAEIIKPFKISTLLHTVNLQMARLRAKAVLPGRPRPARRSPEFVDRGSASTSAVPPRGHVPAATQVALRHRIWPIASEAPVSIVLVEDNKVNQRVMHRILDRLGYHDDAVITTNSGEECLAFLVDAQQQRRLQQLQLPNNNDAPPQKKSGGVTVILMDLTMPGIGGLECTRRIRTDPLLSSNAFTPWIVAQTASTCPETYDACM